MNTNILTQEDVKHIERMYDARQRGLYYSSEVVTDIYNKLYNTNISVTNCGNCIRRRVDAIWAKYQEILELTNPKEETQDGKTEDKKNTQDQGNPDNG